MDLQREACDSLHSLGDSSSLSLRCSLPLCVCVCARARVCVCVCVCRGVEIFKGAVYWATATTAQRRSTLQEPSESAVSAAACIDDISLVTV
eukprot:COSAG03_NODE_333_length_8929_cov_6.096149_2_plen_92_part_00